MTREQELEAEVARLKAEWADIEADAEQLCQLLRKNVERSESFAKEAASLRADAVKLREALVAVESWWLEHGQRVHLGAPAAIFQVRRVLAETAFSVS